MQVTPRTERAVSTRIPEEVIDEVRSANDIVDVISERIPVKRTGRSFKALCPFHEEKTPSFNINQERQIYHCFGCGVGGNVISFVMEYDKIGFIDALKLLADRAGIALPERARGAWDKGQDPAYRMNDLARRYFRDCFLADIGAPAREYCSSRGLVDETLETFSIGYAPPGWSGLLDAARSQDVNGKDLEEAGLVVRRDSGGHYDRFRERLIFPLLSSGNRVVGFGGRALGDHEPKYLNSPETSVYRKSYYLYGVPQARPHLTTTRHAILVEGYMDLLSLYQAGFRATIASAGTALTPEQGRIIARHADTVFVAYDGDSAGISAATRAAEILVQLGLKVRIPEFPEGSDPDSYVREHGADALKERLSGSLDFIDFCAAMGGTATPDEREATARRLIEIVAKVEDPLKADLMLEKVADALSIRKQALTQAFERRRASLEGRTRRQGAVKGETDERKRADETAPLVGAAELAAQKGLLGMLIRSTDDARALLERIAPDEFSDPTIRSVVERISGSVSRGDPIDVSALIDDLSEDRARVLLAEISVESEAPEYGDRLCDDYIRALRRSGVRREIAEIERRIRTAEMTDDEGALISCITRRQELARRLSELSAED